MSNLSSFLEDNSGGFSSTRLAFLLWVVGVLVIWLYTSVQSCALVKIDDSVIVILGILMGGKTVQRFGEKYEPSEKSSGDKKPAAE
jgi:hypothetical protein